MDPRLADLVKLLDLERLEVDLFRGESRDIGSPQVFGGQVLGQALTAASATVEGRIVHSLHAYFLRRGDFNAPIVYQVDRSLDGHAFCNRRVVAIQHGAPIFNMAASFQIVEEGFDHQLQMPQVPPPDLVIYLQAPVEVLQRRIARRGRNFERGVNGEYLAQVADAYTQFFHHYNQSRVLIVNAAAVNLVDGDEDYARLLEQIEGMRGSRAYFNPEAQ